MVEEKVWVGSLLLLDLLVRLPQIVRLLKARSAKGLTFPYFVGDLLGHTTSLAYSLSLARPFFAYSESLFICVQGKPFSLLNALWLWRPVYHLYFLLASHHNISPTLSIGGTDSIIIFLLFYLTKQLNSIFIVCVFRYLAFCC
ncbi:hypothetical protein QOT17_012707 [Balamuthia mandrillaris]